MPINNNLFGVYKSFKLNGTTVVASSVTRNRNMQASPENYVQGTPKARVMSIGAVEETLTVNAPLFVGGGSAVDGRYIANAKIEEILNPATASLPLLSGAQFQIGQENSSVTLTLETDGDPNKTTVFEIRSDEVAELDPIANTPTRLAKFYDFRVQIGSRKYFVLSANISVSATVDKRYFFIPGDWGDFRGWGTKTNTTDVLPNVATGIGSTELHYFTLPGQTGIGLTFQPGTQFPWLGISGVKIQGSGQAAVLLQNLNPGTNANFTDAGETINLSLEPGTTDMTLQDPGIARTEAADFRIEIYDPLWHQDQLNSPLIFDQTWANSHGGLGWTSFLSPMIDTSRSIVHTSNFSLNPGLMTVDFSFICYVK